MALTTLVAGQVIRASTLNTNFGLCVLTDTARTVAVTHSWTASQSFNGGWTAGAACTVTTGGLTVTAGGLTVTAGGETITAGGLTINGATAAGPDVLVKRATGSASLTPLTIRLESTNDAADWSTTVNWANLDFYSDDTTGSGAGVQARVGARRTIGSGAFSMLVLSAGGGSSLTDVVTIDSSLSGTTTVYGGTAAFRVLAPSGVNPAFSVNTTGGTTGTGIGITSAAAASGVTLAAISSGTDEPIIIDGKGAGVVAAAVNSTGAFHVGSLTGASTSFRTNVGATQRAMFFGIANTNTSDKNIGIGNGTAPTGSPALGYFLWAESGALKGRGSSGTNVTIGAADPHCPQCGRDFMTEHQNDSYGSYLSICLFCLADELGDRPYILRAKPKKSYQGTPISVSAIEQQAKRVA